MWGNSLGWSISAVLVLLTGALVYVTMSAARPARATAWSDDPRHFDAIELPAPPPGALPPPSTSDADAGNFYRRAIDAVLVSRTIYERFAESGTLASPEAQQLNAIELLVQGSACRRMTLFASRPDQVINYDHQKPAIDALRLLGRVTLDRLGLLSQRAGRADDAAKYYRAGFALGWHLSQERVAYAELDVGLELLAKSAPALARLAEEAGRTEEAAALLDFDARRAAITSERIDPVLRVARNIDPKIVGAQAGDLFELSTRSKERMWRAEAVLALGRLRYFAGAGGTVGTQRAANRRVTEMAKDEPDPIVRAAAKAARDLTPEQHRMQ